MFPRIVSLLLLALAGVVPLRAAEVLEGPAIAELSPTSAVLRWRTDVPTGTRVTYGVSSAQLNRSAEGKVTDLHEVRLVELQPGTRYFFTVGTARTALARGEFLTSRSPASAQAPASASPATSVPAATPRPPGLLARSIAAITSIKLPGTRKADTSPSQSPPAPTVQAPPTRKTWGDLRSLEDHYVRHGGDFGARSADDYAAQAWRFRERARTGKLLVKLDETGVQRVFDPATNAFAAYNRDGTTKTYFKARGADYFARQPGRMVKTITP